MKEWRRRGRLEAVREAVPRREHRQAKYGKRSATQALVSPAALSDSAAKPVSATEHERFDG